MRWRVKYETVLEAENRTQAVLLAESLIPEKYSKGMKYTVEFIDLDEEMTEEEYSEGAG